MPSPHAVAVCVLAGDMVQNLYEHMGEPMFHTNSSGFELGFDNLEPHDSVVNSVGILGIRCADLPDDEKSKQRYSHILAIIPGPKAPSVLRPFLLRTMRALHDHAPGRRGATPIPVQEAYMDGDVSGGCVRSSMCACRAVRWFCNHAAFWRNDS